MIKDPTCEELETERIPLGRSRCPLSLCGAHANFFFWCDGAIARCSRHAYGPELLIPRGPVAPIDRVRYDRASRLSEPDQNAVEMILRLYPVAEAIDLVTNLRAQGDQAGLEAYLAAAALAEPLRPELLNLNRRRR